MSLAKTLIKVAIGVAVAKGVSTLMKDGASGGTARTPDRPRGVEDIMDGIGGAGTGRRYEPDAGSAGDGGLGDLLGQLTGQKPAAPRRRSNAPQGGLEDLLGGGSQGGAAGGGLGDLLGQLTGGGSANRSTQSGQGGGLGDLLGQLTGGGTAGAGAGQGGGLGDLLGQLTGAAQGGGQGGGLGDLLGQLTGGAATQRGAAPGGGGLGDLLGAVLGGATGGAMTGGPSSRQEDLAAALILRAMVAAVKADGDLDAAEQKKLTQHLEGASREEMAFINAELQRRTDVDDLAAQVPEGMEAQIYVMSLMAINLDNQKEAQYMDRLAKALALEPGEVNALHDRAGAPRLYR